MEKLSTNWDFEVTHLEGPALKVVLWELNGEGRFKAWTLANAHMPSVINAMNSLTDELCEGFFPKPRLTKEQKKALKASAVVTE